MCGCELGPACYSYMAAIWRLASFALAMVIAAIALAMSVEGNLLLEQPYIQSVTKAVLDGLHQFWDYVGPGGKLHPAYFLEHKGHLVIEGLLIVVISFLTLQQSFKPKAKAEEALTEKEIETLCSEWQPEPLVPELAEDERLPDPPVIESAQGIKAVIGGKSVLNLSSANYHALADDEWVLNEAATVINKYGVGSCGPRAFYGTFDVHLKLEDDLAQFMGTEEAIVYSYDTATIASVIPAFASKKDTLVVDEFCSYSIQQGANLSRAKVHFFKHNDMEDLERVLRKVEEQDRRLRKPLTRRFIVVESVFANSGGLAPLDRIYELKERYRWRLIVEESHALGVLGATGRGGCEHFGLKPQQAEVVCGALSTSLGSVGGFCVGSREMCDHQRLSGSGYIFSASLPPFLAAAASAALSRLAAQQELPARLAANARALRMALAATPGLRVYGVDGDGSATSPLVHMHLEPPVESDVAGDALLTRIADIALKRHSVLVAVARYSRLERSRPPPSLKLYASSAMTQRHIAQVAKAVSEAAAEVLGSATLGQ